MFRLVALCASAVLCLAQTPANRPDTPPADVDRVLRARVTQFYQLETDGKYRKAEALIAEESKDIFYDSPKPRYLNFEIERIEYSKDYTRAKVITNTEQVVPGPAFGNKPFKLPTPSSWKLVDGEWYWYVDTEAVIQTPFGPVKTAPGSNAAALPAPVTMPKAEEMFRNLVNQIKADKQSLTLKAGEPQQVTLSNGAPGTISIALLGSLPGVTVKLDRLQMKPGEKAILTFRAGATAKPGTVSVLVEQTNQVIPIQIQIQ